METVTREALMGEIKTNCASARHFVGCNLKLQQMLIAFEGDVQPV